MQIFKAATPGFLFTLAATGLLAVVSFSVPWFKSVYFLRAAISQSGVNGSVTFGVLGYCLDFNNQITCSNASVGWEFNPNTLLGNDLPIQIPNVVVKWITYVLVLHIVALGLSGASAVFGLLAHVRNMTMSCFSSCIAGTAAAVALIAFIFDLVLFFAVRARVNNIQGGSASIGNALWMTLAAWALLFFSGCAYAFGRCCVSKSPSGGSGWRRPRKDSERSDDGGKYDRESEHMRLDAVKAEADRKARQREGPREVGLPAFHEYERTPLRKEEPKQYYEEEVEVIVPYTDRPGREPSRASHRTETSGAGSTGYRPNRNYQPGTPGTRAIDDYYNNTAPTAASLAAANTYPPKPQSQRRPSEHTQYQASVGQPHRQASSHSSGYDPYGQTQRNVPPPVPALPQVYQSQSPPTQPAEPYVAPTQSHSRADPYLAIAAATSGAAAAGYANNRGYSGDNYNHEQYPSSHQQYPSASQQYTQNQGNQDPYAGSSYNPQAAVMSPPQPTHYLDNSNSEYQRYDDGQQQHGYDPYGQQQQHDLYAEQQQRDPYARDPYAQDPYAQQQGYDPYGQQRGYDSYGQQGYDSYANQEYSQQAYSSAAPVAQPQPVPALMPQAQVQEPEPEPRTMVASPERGLVSSPSPMHTPSYTPQPPQNISTAVAVAGPSSGQGHQHNWSITRSEESPSEAPPPQYEATPGTTGYPVEKR